MKKIILGVSTAVIMMAVPSVAQAQLFGGFDNSTVLGGSVGASTGAIIGSQLAPTGNRTEGSAIGAVVGGLAGAAYGNSQSNYYGNPYAGSFNPGFNTRNLVGAGAGAALGGAIGSNLAGSGVQQEGTAIGALLGGAAGYALANRGNGRYGSPAYAGNGRYGRSGRYGSRPVAQTSGRYGTSGYGYHHGYHHGYTAAPRVIPMAPVRYVAPVRHMTHVVPVVRQAPRPSIVTVPTPSMPQVSGQYSAQPVQLQPVPNSVAQTQMISNAGMVQNAAPVTMTQPVTVTQPIKVIRPITIERPVTVQQEVIVEQPVTIRETVNYTQNVTTAEPNVISNTSTTTGTVFNESMVNTSSDMMVSDHMIHAPLPAPTGHSHTMSDSHYNYEGVYSDCASGSSTCHSNTAVNAGGCGTSDNVLCYAGSDKRYDHLGRLIK